MFCMFLADGFEEAEALVTLDLLRRGGIDVKSVCVASEIVTGAHHIKVIADKSIEDISENLCDGIILPGGMPGTENLYSSPRLVSLIKRCYASGKLIAAICAAPIILGRLSLLNKKNAVCFPGFERELSEAVISDKLCVRDNNIITAKGAGAVFEFSFEIIKYVKNETTASKVLTDIQYPTTF